MGNEELKKNWVYFLNNVKELTKKYGEQFIVLKNEKVIGHYRTFDEAYTETTKKEKLGTFIIQQCGDESHYTARFHSRVAV